MSDTLSNIDKAIEDTMGTSGAQGDNDGGSNADTGSSADGAQDQGGKPDAKGTDANGDANTSGQPAGNTGGKQSVTQSGGKQPAQAQQPNKDGKGGNKDGQGAGQPDSGAFRRLSEANTRLTTEARRLAEVNTQLSAEVAALKSANTIGTQLGLDAQQQTLSMQLMSQYIKNPLGTLKYLLTEAAAGGHNIATLFEGGGAAIHTDAVARMLDERLKPFTDAQRASSEQQRAMDDANREIDTFLERHGDAAVHLDSIEALIRRDQTLTLREAYLELKAYAVENGYDFTQPLKPQMLARQNGGNPPANNGGATTRQSNGGVPLPNGRANLSTPAARVNPGNQAQQTDSFNEMDSKDIVKAAMRENGIQI